MTIPSTVDSNYYVGNGATGVYPYGYKIFNQADLDVTVRNPVTGTETPLVLTTDYTVSGVLDPSGGNVTLVEAGQAWMDGAGHLENLWPISVRRNREALQETDISNQGPLLPEVVEDSFDHVIMLIQKLIGDLERSMRLGDTIDPSVVDPKLPTPVANAALRWNSTADGIENFSLAAAGTISLPVVNGFLVETASGGGVLTARTFQPGTGIGITNPNGVAGDPTFSILASGVDTAQLNASAVTAPKIDTDAVITRTIKDLNVTTAKLDNLAVTAGKLATDAVTTAKILNANVTGPKLAVDSVSAANVIALNITTPKLADDAATGDKIGDGGVEVKGTLGADATVNPSAATAIFTKSIAGGDLSTDRTAIFNGMLTATNGSGVNRVLNVAVQYGATLVAAATVTIANGVTANVDVVGILQAKAATNVQWASSRITADAVAAATPNVGCNGGAAAEDSTAAKDFSIMVHWTGATAGNIVLKSGALRIAK